MIKRDALILFTILVLAGCSNKASTIQPISSPEVLADCFVTFYLTAWQDSDADGVRDASEPLLEDVEFLAEGKYAYSAAKGRAFSDQNGEAVIDTWTPGSCPGQITVRAVAPDGFRFTTDEKVSFNFSDSVTEYPMVGFGFQKLE